MAWWSAGTILLSAFLLFQVQPIISKKILPWFGGSPAVWTTCVLFFQLALLGGYAYSHFLTKHLSIRWQGVIHTALLVLALFTLPIVPWDHWKPQDGNHPALRIMVLLLVVVGASYFLLSTTGPLVQAWFARLYPGRSPYRLYALSNVGSLFALLSYPFLIETTLMVDTQGYLWTAAFVVFAILIGIMALTMWREAKLDEPAAQQVSASTLPNPAPAGNPPAKDPAADTPPSPWLRLGWLGLAATATMTFLAFTNHLCQDIAVVPFMWVIPLSLYLLTFIICFDSERWYVRSLFGIVTVLAILWLTAMLNYSDVDDALEKPERFLAAILTRPKLENAADIEAYQKKSFSEKMDAVKPWLASPFSTPMNKVFKGIGGAVSLIDIPYQWRQQNIPKDDRSHISFECSMGEFSDHVIAISTSFMLVLFLICMVCHGELVKSKPQPRHLTSFYLFISLGGALGGLFVALICPIIFKSHFELPMTLIGGCLVAWIAIMNAGRLSWLKSRELLQWAFAFLLVGTTLLVAKGNIEATEPNRWLSVFPAVIREKLVAWNIVPKPDEDIVAVDRNFYGTVQVSKLGDFSDPSNSGYALYNGRIWHGFQYQDPSRHLEPTTYYVEGTGAALSVTEHPKRKAGQGMKVGVIGLGTGSMSTHAKPGDKYYFYDIDPKIVNFAKTYFTYLAKSPGKPEVLLGDARIVMERQEPQNYDVIVLDAFSGDAIPAHLLTDEAFSLYERHLNKDASGNPDGVVVIHISNRYLDLEPVVAAIAEKHKYQTVNVHAQGDGSIADTASDWVLVTRNKEFLASSAVKGAGEPLKPKTRVLWTDQYTALKPILK